MEKKQPEMNNSYIDKMAHKLPSTFIAQLCSILFSVKHGHDWQDRCEIKVTFPKTDTT